MAIKTLDSNQARNHWRAMLDAVLNDEMEVVITRYDQPVVTVVAYEDYLAVREHLIQQRTKRRARKQAEHESMATMIASERVLARDWDTPEEDAAWRDL